MGRGRTEDLLVGGRQSGNVVRVGDTVRRVPGRNAEYVRALLVHLQSQGLLGVPRWLGIDERGRDILTFISGEVGHGDAARLSDARLTSSAKLIRRFHDATAESMLAQGCEVVTHADLGPHNTVFLGDEAVGLIDWDDAEPGTRLMDFAHAVWCFVPVGEEGGPLDRQGRRIRLLCDSYGWADVTEVIDEVGQRLRRAASQHAVAGHEKGVDIFNDLSAWLSSHEATILRHARVPLGLEHAQNPARPVSKLTSSSAGCLYETGNNPQGPLFRRRRHGVAPVQSPEDHWA